jgi:Cu/Ag efflux pump CusA
VVEDHQPLIGDALVSQGDGDLLFVVEKLPEANTLEVTRNLEKALTLMQPGLAGVKLDPSVYRPASYIDTALENLQLALIVGAVLVALALAAFFLQLWTTLIALLVIPVSLVAAALTLVYLGTTLNAIVLVGLVAAIVLLIDDGVVGVDAVARHLRLRRPDQNGKSAEGFVADATVEARGVTTYATLAVALALLPLFFLERLAGSFFPDLAGAFLLALLASLVVGMTLTPALSSLLVRRIPLDREPRLASWLRRSYERILSGVVRRSRWVLVAAGVVVVATCATLPFLSTSLLPSFKEEQVLVRLDGAPGTSLPEMNRITSRAARELRSVPGVTQVGAHVGRAIASDLSATANSAELWVGLDTSADYDATLASIRDVMRGYPGLSSEIGSFANARASDVLSTTRSEKDFVVRLYGEQQDTLEAQAERIRQAVAGVSGAADVAIEYPTQEPTVEVEVDLAAAEARGIKPGDVRRAAATLLGGLRVGNLFEQQKVFDVVVWGTPETRSSLTSIRNLLVETPDGRYVRLGEVASVRIAPNAAVVERQGVSRYLDITANANGRDRDAVAQEAKSVLQEMSFPLEYTPVVLDGGGQPVTRLLLLALGALVGIFLLLESCLGSWRLAITCFLTFPVAITGALLTVAIVDGGALTFGSVIAVFAVAALALRNGLLLVEHLERLERHGKPAGVDVLLAGAGEHAAPVLATAVASALALSPFVAMGGVAGYEVAHSAALVVIGGLVTSTLLTLFVVPVVYLRFGRGRVAEPEAEPIEQLLADITPTPHEPIAGGVAMQPEPEPGT